MREKPTLVLLHGHGVDASIGEGIYADLSLGGPVPRLTNHVTGGLVGVWGIWLSCGV